MIIPLYQPLGSSSHQLAAYVGRLLGEKATHTGTLDPMAEGVLVVLTGEDRFQKEQLANWHKVYEFSLLWGVSTDTDDSLGMKKDRVYTPEKDFSPSAHDLEVHVREILPEFVGIQAQKQHPFSAKRWQGQSFFDLAAKKQPLPDLSHEIEVTSLEYVATETIQKSVLEKEWHTRLKMVSGEWRQDQILESWQPFWEQPTDSPLVMSKLRIRCSKRTYIRQIANDIAKRVSHPTVVWNLRRTQNGPYRLKVDNTLELVQELD